MQRKRIPYYFTILTLAFVTTSLWAANASALTDVQQTVLAKLNLFDRTYSRWIKEEVSVPEIWEYLGVEVFGEYAEMACSGDAQSDAPFILRGMLASGVSYLYAAQAYQEAGPDGLAKFLECYERGLEALEIVIQIDAQNSDIDVLPNLTVQGLSTEPSFVGFETILVGVTALPEKLSNLTRALYTNRNQYSLQSLQYLSLDAYQTAVSQWWQEADAEKQQTATTQFQPGSTVATARLFLSEFCPWGLGVFQTLNEAGLTADLDWRILRPFAGKRPQDMSEFTIQDDQIPAHVRQELEQIMGGGQKGFLDAAKTKPIQWAWTHQPVTYTVKFVSPLVYERQRLDDQFSSAMGYVKWCFGGPIDYMVDVTLSKLLDAVVNQYGEDKDIHYLSRVLLEGNDTDLSTTGFVKHQELPAPGMILRKTTGAAFAALEEQMLQNLYEAVDPRTFHLGTGYDGQPIPPIMIRGDVLGFEQVPADAVGRSVQAVRHYRLRPAAITQKNPSFAYDLSQNQGLGALRKDRYLQEQQSSSDQSKEVVRKNAWLKLPTPFGTRNYINDFSPGNN